MVRIFLLGCNGFIEEWGGSFGVLFSGDTCMGAVFEGEGSDAFTDGGKGAGGRITFLGSTIGSFFFSGSALVSGGDAISRATWVWVGGK